MDRLMDCVMIALCKPSSAANNPQQSFVDEELHKTCLTQIIMLEEEVKDLKRKNKELEKAYYPLISLAENIKSQRKLE
jgi:hypothetical protein